MDRIGPNWRRPSRSFRLHSSSGPAESTSIACFLRTSALFSVLAAILIRFSPEMSGIPNWETTEKGMVRCVQCGDLYPAAATTNGELVPIGGADGSRCHACGGDEFEQMRYIPSD
jgi:hypothetical protein